MASLFERQRADVESRLDAIVRGGEPVTSRALASLQGALGLDDVILDDEGVPRDAPGSDTRALVEHALCRLTQRVMQEELEGGGEAGPGSTARHDHDADDDDDDDAPEHHRPSVESRLDRCLDLALALSESGVAEPGSVFVAAEQVFEASTVEACARVFSWVERARERLSAEALWRRGKLTMLRTCNDLARRLSKGKTSDVVLRGRVSLLLAALYPLSERSALNVSGAYNNDEKRYDVEKRFSPGAGGESLADVLDGTTPQKETRSAIVADVDSADLLVVTDSLVDVSPFAAKFAWHATHAASRAGNGWAEMDAWWAEKGGDEKGAAVVAEAGRRLRAMRAAAETGSRSKKPKKPKKFLFMLPSEWMFGKEDVAENLRMSVAVADALGGGAVTAVTDFDDGGPSVPSVAATVPFATHSAVAAALLRSGGKVDYAAKDVGGWSTFFKGTGERGMEGSLGRLTEASRSRRWSARRATRFFCRRRARAPETTRLLSGKKRKEKSGPRRAAVGYAGTRRVCFPRRSAGSLAAITRRAGASSTPSRPGAFRLW